MEVLLDFLENLPDFPCIHFRFPILRSNCENLLLNIKKIHFILRYFRKSSEKITQKSKINLQIMFCVKWSCFNDLLCLIYIRILIYFNIFSVPYFPVFALIKKIFWKPSSKTCIHSNAIKLGAEQSAWLSLWLLQRIRNIVDDDVVAVATVLVLLIVNSSYETRCVGWRVTSTKM